MSDSGMRADLVVWPRETRIAAVPGRAPGHRHDALPGLAGLDWRLRRAWRCRREEAFLRSALAGTPPAPAAAARPGDLTLRRVLIAFSAVREAAPEISAGVTPLQVLALLRGNYLVLEPGRRLPAVAMATAVALRCGLGVHVACASKDSAAALLPMVQAAVAGAAPVHGLAESPEDRSLLATGEVVAVVGTAAAFAHAWLRWGGEQDALVRAAAMLGGNTGPHFSFAPLLLCAEGDVLLLDMLRHPLQLTSSRPDDAARFMQQVARVVEGLAEGRDVADGALTPAGEAVLASVAVEAGGLWAVPGLRRRYATALLRARALEPETHFVMAGGRLQWKVDPLMLAGEPAEAAALELALRTLQGEPPAQRISRRAWFADFFGGYARVAATGPALGGEAADLWWLHGLVVLGNRTRPLAVTWSPLPLATLATVPGSVVATRALAARPGLPAALPCLESAEGQRQAAEIQAAGQAVQVLGLPAAPRQLPPGVSIIMLAGDDPQLPAPIAALAARSRALGGVGRALQRLLAHWLQGQSNRQRFRARQALVLRAHQERRTYAFTGEAREA